MKKACFILTIYVLLLISLTSIVVADSETSIGFPDNMVTQSGSKIDLPIVLTGCNGFTNISLEISYDSNALTLESISDGDKSGAMFMPSQYAYENPQYLIWVSTSNTTYNGEMAVLHFSVNDTFTGLTEVKIDYDRGFSGNNVDGISVNFDQSKASLNLKYMPTKIFVTNSNVNVDDIVAYKASYDSNGKMLSVENIDVWDTVEEKQKIFYLNRITFEPLI